MTEGLLSTPIRIGAVTLKNRWVMAAMGTAYARADGEVTDQLIRYLARRAQGGLGLVVTEAAAVDASGAPFPGVLRADDDSRLAGLERLARAVKAGGAAVALQIYHAGRQMSERFAGLQPVAPSAIPCPFVRALPRALEAREIESLVERFAEAAGRARAAGFDAVELNGGHGYLLHQFLSPLSNRREDGWGGDPERRARFAVEVVRRIRARVGPGFPILYKISAEEHLPGGLALDDTVAIGRRLVEAGTDALVVSSGTYASFEWIVQPRVMPPATLRSSAAAFKRALGVPVAAVGRITDPAMAGTILASGDADLIAVGRALLADPDLPRKSAGGRADEIRPCIGCNECLRELFEARPVRCAVNPETGHEAEYPAVRAAAAKRVVVIGGGPAGMQAAAVARERGHEVTLLEARSALGGRLRLAAGIAWEDGLARLLSWMARRLETLAVTVRLDVATPLAEVARERPDMVIVATGGRTSIPPIPGIAHPRVRSAEQWLGEQAAGVASVPLRVEAVAIGDDVAACQAAWLLGERGATVTLLTTGAEPARELEGVTRRALAAWLRSAGVAIETRARIEEIGASAVHHLDAAGMRRECPAGLVVVSAPAEPDESLREDVERAGIPARAVGDCVAPGGVLGAIHGATEAARTL